MNFSISIGNVISKYNPIAILRRKKMRTALKNKNISFLAPNCIAGILFHDLNLQFLSPTINTMMFQRDFINLVAHLDEYLTSELNFYKDNQYEFPCAKIHPEGLNEITVHFTHYDNEDDAKRKWVERSTRIQKDNIFILVSERDGITKNEIEQLGSLNVRGIVAFTYNDYPNIPYTVYIPKYKDLGCVGNILERHYFDDSREYERFFDFVSWFNDASGKDYDVRKFKRI